MFDTLVFGDGDMIVTVGQQSDENLGLVFPDDLVHKMGFFEGDHDWDSVNHAQYSYPTWEDQEIIRGC